MRRDIHRKLIRVINRSVERVAPRLLGANFVKGGNFHQIDIQFYRSGQLDADRLEEKIKLHNIKSVINLRGERSGRHWYDEEREVCSDLGVEHHDSRIVLSDPRRSFLEYIAVMRGAARPVLVHCTGGKDRAAIASAVYRMVFRGEKVDSAKEELSSKYGHKTGEYDEFLQDYKINGEGKGMSFSEWISSYSGSLIHNGVEVRTIEN